MATTPALTGADARAGNAKLDAGSDKIRVEEALEVARALVRLGVPVFAAPPNSHYGQPDENGNADERLFIEPPGWQNLEPDLAEVDKWRPDWMLAAVTGRAADVIDTDPRNGGCESRAAVDLFMPRVFGVVRTHRLGTHEWVDRLHRRKRSGSGALMPGLDILAGDDDGKGRAYVRIPPTRTPLGEYRWESVPDVQGLALGDPDGVTQFVEQFYDPLVEEANGAGPSPTYDGHPLSERERRYLEATLNREAGEVAAAQNPTRNSRLFTAARRLGNLVAGAGLDPDAVTRVLTEAASRSGLSLGEIGTTLRSGLAIGQHYPRSVLKGEVPDGTPEMEDADLVDLVGLLEGGLEGPQPTILRVEGGEALFYPQSLNGLMGEPESGKSWLALTAVAQVAVDSNALIIDLEDLPQTTARRLSQLGLDAADMVRVHYSRPHDAAELTARLVKATAAPPALVVIDAMAELLLMLGAGSYDNDEVTLVVQKYLQPLAHAGACVVVLDHVVKAKDSRGRYPIGAQAKLAAISGAMYTVKALTPLAPGRTGTLKLEVAKDRPGHVRSWASSGKVVGIAEVVSAEERVSVVIRPEAGQEDGFRPTVSMKKVSEFLEAKVLPVSRNDVQKGVEGKAIYIRQAIDCLLNEGFLEEVANGRFPKIRSVRAFREPA